MSKSDDKTANDANFTITSKEFKDQKISSDQLQLPANNVIVEKLILQNFLSFEYDEIIFDPNFTIVMGPNGAGKSSIYQALKFVLGSNDYDGRYSKWSDFIHTGAKKAVVQIHIRINQLEYLIQRVVFQNGAPKFFFKKPGDEKLSSVSGHEIHTFLKELQIDPNNIFAFMSQGNIDSIKDFKEEELCYFVERGLGLNITREQIIEIKRDISRLKQEEQTLLAERDNMNYKLTELMPLIEKLKQKKILLSKLNEVEFELIVCQKVEIQNKIQEFSQKRTQISNDIQKSELKIAEIEQKITQENQEKLQKTKQFQDLRDKRQQLSERYKLINEQIKEWTDEKNEIAQQIQNCEQKISDLSKSLKQTLSELAFQNSQIQKAKDRINKIQLEMDQLDEKEQNLKLEMEKYSLSLSKLESEQKIASIIKNQLTADQKEYDSLEQDINKKVREIAKIKNGLQKYKWFLKNPTPNLPDLIRKEKENMMQKKSDLGNILQELQEKYRNYSQEMEKIKESIIDKSFPKPRAIQALMDEIRERKLNCIGPLIDYISYEEIYRTAVESIFGPSVLFSFIAKDSENFHILTQLVKKHAANCKIYKERNQPVTPLPNINPNPSSGIFGYLAEKINPTIPDPAIKKVIYSVASKTLVVKDHLTGEQYIERYNWRNWVVTLDGDQIRPKKLVLEARPRIFPSNRQKFQNVAHAKQRIEQIKQKMTKNRDLYSQREQLLKKVVKNLAILEDRLKDVDKLASDYKLMEIKSVSKNNSITKRTELYEKIKQQEIDLNEKLESIELIKKGIPESLVEEKRQLDEIPLEREQLVEKLTEYEKTKENLEKNLENLKTQKIQLQTRIDDLTAQNHQKKSELQTKDGKFFQLFQDSMQLKKEIQTLELQEIEAEKPISQIEEKIKELYDLKQTQATEIETLKHQLLHVNQELLENEEKLEIIKETLDKSEKLPIPRPIEEIQEEIQYLKHQISLFKVDDRILLEKEKLENILDRINEKRQTLQKELEAAKISHKQLESIFSRNFSEKIQKLEDLSNQMLNNIKQNFIIRIKLVGEVESLRLSVTTITKVNEKSTIYPLQAVSGGQRSLVGICLILSLNHLNPSPINIYDEMDMFLDEKNAESIAQLINLQAQGGIQFILLMPSKNVPLLKSASKVIGVSRNGKYGPSSVHYSKVFASN